MNKARIEGTALKMLHDELEEAMKISPDISLLWLVVSPESKLSCFDFVETDYGDIKVKVSTYVTKGAAYILQAPDTGPRAFQWVSKGGKLH